MRKTARDRGSTVISAGAGIGSNTVIYLQQQSLASHHNIYMETFICFNSCNIWLPAVAHYLSLSSSSTSSELAQSSSSSKSTIRDRIWGTTHKHSAVSKMDQKIRTQIGLKINTGCTYDRHMLHCCSFRVLKTLPS